MQKTKHAAQSKINISATVIMITNLLLAWNILPARYATEIISTVNIIGPALIVYFRMYRTNTRLTWGGQ